MNFHETVRGARFFDNQIPRLIKALEQIAENGKSRKIEQQCVGVDSLSAYLADGWSFVGTFRESYGNEVAIVEREVK